MVSHTSIATDTEPARTPGVIAPATPPFESHRSHVLRVVAHRARWLDPADREAVVNDAYVVLLEKQRNGALDPGSMRPDQVRAYLVHTALHKALDERKRVCRRRSISLDQAPEGEFADTAAPLADTLAARLDSQWVRELVCELPERQRQVITLRYFFERSPEEIQRHLQVSPRTYRRLLEQAMRTLLERYPMVTEGTLCEQRRSMILAWWDGITTADRAQPARRHLARCPACTRWAAEQRGARSEAAPPPVRRIA